MAIPENPKALAWEIAKGILFVTTAQLKQYTEADLKALAAALTVVQREIRAGHAAPDDMPSLKEKNQRLQRISHLLTLIEHYARKNRLHV